MSTTPTDHPLGDINQDSTSSEPINARSIVDEVLNLDAFLSGEVRRAEKTAQFCTRPDIEAEIEELHAELDALTDAQGRPLATDDDLAGAERSATLVVSELRAKQREYAAAMAFVRVRAMDEDDWTAFQAKHKKVTDDGPPYPADFYEDLIMSSTPRITMPGGSSEKITVPQLRKLRKALGHAAFNEISQAAWSVNVASGVNVPKSPLSSAVQRHLERD